MSPDVRVETIVEYQAHCTTCDWWGDLTNEADKAATDADWHREDCDA